MLEKVSLDWKYFNRKMVSEDLSKPNLKDPRPLPSLLKMTVCCASANMVLKYSLLRPITSLHTPMRNVMWALQWCNDLATLSQQNGDLHTQNVPMFTSSKFQAYRSFSTDMSCFLFSECDYWLSSATRSKSIKWWSYCKGRKGAITSVRSLIQTQFWELFK